MDFQRFISVIGLFIIAIYFLILLDEEDIVQLPIQRPKQDTFCC